MNNDLNARIHTLREDYERALHAKQRMDALLAEVHTLYTRMEDLAQKRAKEEKDVARMESGSLAAYFYALIGKKEEKLTRECEEALQAAVLYDAVCAEYCAVKDEINRIEPEAEQLYARKFELQKALAEKKQLMKNDPQHAERILELEENLAACRSRQREVNEAIRAASRALYTAQEAESELQEAEKLGGWDVIGGGMWVDIAKHSHMDSAQESINRLQGELRLMRSELNDVRIHADVQVKAEDFSRFADMFWDNVFTDFSMLDRITSALSSIRSVCGSIESTLARLERMKAEEEQAYADAQKALDDFVANNPLT